MRVTTLEALLSKFTETGDNINGEATQTPICPGWVCKVECSLSSGHYSFQKGLEVVLTMDVLMQLSSFSFILSSSHKAQEKLVTGAVFCSFQFLKK
jgi:hypothetical protein